MSIEDLYNRGMTEMMLGNAKKALSIFSCVLQAEPSHVGALIRLGNIFGRLARYADAVSCYDRALKTDPLNALALVNKGLALHYLERYDEAVSCYDEILRSRPHNALATYNKASSMVRLGRVEEGVELLNNAIRVDISYKYKAREDIDFAAIRETHGFRSIVT